MDPSCEEQVPDSVLDLENSLAEAVAAEELVVGLLVVAALSLRDLNPSQRKARNKTFDRLPWYEATQDIDKDLDNSYFSDPKRS